jgi:hypothetical protein
MAASCAADDASAELRRRDVTAPSDAVYRAGDPHPRARGEFDLDRPAIDRTGRRSLRRDPHRRKPDPRPDTQLPPPAIQLVGLNAR